MKISIQDTFKRDDVKEKFQAILGEKAPGFIMSVVSTVNSDTNFDNVDRNSILFAAATAATLDLPINQNLGFAYIIPYKGKAQFQIGYKGYIQLAQRSGLFKTISATKIYDGQIVEENPLTGYRFDFTTKTLGKPIGYAAYFELLNRFSKTFYMTTKEVEKHATKYSQTYKKGFGAWKDEFEAMAIKTVIKLLLSKYAPLSISMQKAMLADQAIVKDWEGNEFEYVDNKPETLDDINEQKEQGRVIEFITKKAKDVKSLKAIEDQVKQLKNEDLNDLYQAKLDELKNKNGK